MNKNHKKVTTYDEVIHRDNLVITTELGAIHEC
jgi:hypothetical protein